MGRRRRPTLIERRKAKQELQIANAKVRLEAALEKVQPRDIWVGLDHTGETILYHVLSVFLNPPGAKYGVNILMVYYCIIITRNGSTWEHSYPVRMFLSCKCSRNSKRKLAVRPLQEVT